eukprot:GHVU01013291.1.p1 GENE.GHVU01013291.1~~GHVU01013291.1.p1  ORF type:complete len:138 (+),score=2.00 GHVU01013291.1:843-1256(+)
MFTSKVQQFVIWSISNLVRLPRLSYWHSVDDNTQAASQPAKQTPKQARRMHTEGLRTEDEWRRNDPTAVRIDRSTISIYQPSSIHSSAPWRCCECSRGVRATPPLFTSRAHSLTHSLMCPPMPPFAALHKLPHSLAS